MVYTKIDWSSCAANAQPTTNFLYLTMSENGELINSNTKNHEIINNSRPKNSSYKELTGNKN